LARRRLESKGRKPSAIMAQPTRGPSRLGLRLPLAPGADGLAKHNFAHGVKLDAPSNLTAKKRSRSGQARPRPSSARTPLPLAPRADGLGENATQLRPSGRFPATVWPDPNPTCVTDLNVCWRAISQPTRPRPMELTVAAVQAENDRPPMVPNLAVFDIRIRR